MTAGSGEPATRHPCGWLTTLWTGQKQYRAWKRALTPEQRSNQVSAVFLLWFGDSGAMPSDMAARIADAINAARVQHLPR